MGLLGIALIIMGVVNLRNIATFMLGADLVDATVVTVAMERDADKTRYRPTFRIADENGTEIRAAADSTLSTSVRPGDVIAVYYNPAMSGSVKLNNLFAIWWKGAFPLLIGLILVYLKWGLPGFNRNIATQHPRRTVAIDPAQDIDKYTPRHDDKMHDNSSVVRRR